VRLTGRRRFDNPLRLQGQYYDEELGLCYNRHRYYGPVTCSFISREPLGLAEGTNQGTRVEDTAHELFRLV
jgi:RHS repeat-associated protein